jgi:hypothetical protein
MNAGDCLGTLVAVDENGSRDMSGLAPISFVYGPSDRRRTAYAFNVDYNRTSLRQQQLSSIKSVSGMPKIVYYGAGVDGCSWRT